MGFGENLQYLRKRGDITQEQLAERLGVSRQTVSKWESNVSYPEMEKLLSLCEMFSCTMDTLLRGDAAQVLCEDTADYDRHINGFSRRIALGVALILSGVTLHLALSGFGAPEAAAIVALLLPVIAAVLLLIVTGIRHTEFQRKNPEIKPFYAPDEIEAYRRRFPARIGIGIGLILVGLLAAYLGGEIAPPRGCTEDVYNAAFMLLVTAGVPLIVYAGIQNGKYDIEAYNRENRADDRSKEIDRKTGVWCACIMLSATILFLIGGFALDRWGSCWIVYPVGGLLCGIVAVILSGGKKS